MTFIDEWFYSPSCHEDVKSPCPASNLKDAAQWYTIFGMNGRVVLNSERLTEEIANMLFTKIFLRPTKDEENVQMCPNSRTIRHDFSHRYLGTYTLATTAGMDAKIQETYIIR
ncbi:hypothetical protein POX_b02062 [Penicillium oxalicum]|uniref:hypothetical protein n=1 Tax=Penicillium oxalicum TaxID=69781 RepID=UPI0020B7490D|nr:hypothetical protein POX_b02062 [Penicillium oxalicum]KAI2792029.1 hypothetical protein POX_b02062 [Penicillium oxalicum]